ncbi:MAG: hypothetical protein VKJ09_00550 [Leptolyngbya sp.]|nr:hypothetical protein [Leptolyngbya sp.]
MVDPLFWLGLSFFLVAVSLTAVLLVLVPAVRELSRAARSVEKLCDTISRELPPTLESIRLTSLEITELTDDVTEGVQHAGRVVQQVDQSLSGVRQQAQRVQIGTRSVMAGFQAAWSTFTRSPKGRPPSREGRKPVSAPPRRRLQASAAPTLEPLTHSVPPASQLPAGSPLPPPSPQNGVTSDLPPSRPEDEAAPTRSREDG